MELLNTHFYFSLILPGEILTLFATKLWRVVNTQTGSYNHYILRGPMFIHQPITKYLPSTWQDIDQLILIE